MGNCCGNCLRKCGNCLRKCGNCLRNLFNSASKPQIYKNEKELVIKVTLKSYCFSCFFYDERKEEIQQAIENNSIFIQQTNKELKEIQIDNLDFECITKKESIGNFNSQCELNFKVPVNAFQYKYVLSNMHPSYFMKDDIGNDRGQFVIINIDGIQEEKGDYESNGENQYIIIIQKDEAKIKNYLQLKINQQIIEINDLSPGCVILQQNHQYIYVITQYFRDNLQYEDTIYKIQNSTSGFQKNVKVISIISDAGVDIDDKPSDSNGIVFQNIRINRESDYKKIQLEINKEW